MRSRILAIASLALGAGCSRPDALVVCHNANCVEPADALRDDTLEALRDSLALEHAGRPAIDGIELDSFFRGSDDTCLYAHDIADNSENTAATAPAVELAIHFARPGPITYGGGPFQVLMELKSHVSVDTQDRHTPRQRTLHALCAWNVYGIIAAAAVANDRDVVVDISAFAPELIQALIDTRPAVTPVRVRYAAIQGVPSPLDDQTRPFGDYLGLPIESVEFHNQWILDAQYEQLLGDPRDLDVALFMFSATVETFAAVEQYRPHAVVTNEARLFRRWLAD